MPAGPSKTKVYEQDRAYFADKWKAALSRGIWTILLLNLDCTANAVAVPSLSLPFLNCLIGPTARWGTVILKN